MESRGPTREEIEDAEELHDMRLRALLHELARDKGGHRGAASALGLDHRTVAACMEGGGMSWRVREALERGIESGASPAAVQQRERTEALEQRVEEMEQHMEALGKEMRGGLEAVKGGIEAMREAHAQGLRQFERRLAAAEAGRRDPGTVAEAPTVGRKPAVVRERRQHAELVTVDPAPDDEEVFGFAWPLVDEWRRLRAGHPGKGKGLSWLVERERVLELEVAMLEEHGLTLPPEKAPLRGRWRDAQLRWRKEALDDARRARAWRELLRWARRALTLGLWWK